MQRLVAVDSWNRDVILEPAGHRLEELVRQAEHSIAGLDVLDDDADAVNVDDIRQMDPLALHLAIDAVDVFLASEHARLDPGLGQSGLELAVDLFQQLALAA